MFAPCGLVGFELPCETRPDSKFLCVDASQLRAGAKLNFVASARCNGADVACEKHFRIFNAL